MESHTPAAVIPAPIETEQREARWPKVLGVISLIYAILGLCCASGYALSLVFMDTLMAMGGMKAPDLPPAVALGGYAMIVFWVMLGVFMITASIKLIRRQPAAVKMLKTWAFLRVLFVLFGIAWTVLTAGAQMDFQRSIWEMQEERVKESGGKMPGEPPTDEDLWQSMMINSGILSACMVIYPVFIIFYLSRRSINDEVAHWR
jgi:hypothetical protein